MTNTQRDLLDGCATVGWILLPSFAIALGPSVEGWIAGLLFTAAGLYLLFVRRPA